MAIFFSTTVVVLLTFIAFIVNIGIFVKAKINLQNATDAAAYAGASVQARQLSNIAYMNWEMRNVFKEWMFKYYVLGNLNIKSVREGPASTEMDFLMESYAGTGTTSAANDTYNFPSICIDYAETGGIGMCSRYLIPGLPRFESANVLGMDDTTNAFVDALVSEKGLDCSQRSKMNFLTATTWAYNVNLKTPNPALQAITAAAPQMATEYMGAFPQAFEVALRIRNLEYQVNTPPMNGVCLDVSEGVDCNVLANSLTAPSHERAFKAYTSAWRNLGSNGAQDGADSDRSFKNSFTLKEISPQLNTSINMEVSLSTSLIPPDKRQKYYLDLKLMTLNYSTFYTSFTTTQGSGSDGAGGSTSFEGQCDVTKVGLPVPGYPLGFVKNPDFLTYYAVEGKTKFVGLFNPFNPFTEQVVMKAYAAAKPFGGRIGPALFDVQNQQYIRLRSAKKSSPYITSLDTASFVDTFGNSVPGDIYKPGLPLPMNTSASQFWLTGDSDAVGGWIDEKKIFYGIPNIVWDYPSGDIQSSDLYQSSLQIEQVGAGAGAQTPRAGLYNKDMFAGFKSVLENIDGTSGPVSTDQIDRALKAVRSPTLYEAHNYMIPTPEETNQALETDSWGVITKPVAGSRFSTNGQEFAEFQLELYAPMLSPSDPNNLYSGIDQVMEQLEQYIDHQERAVMKYRNSLNVVAASIFNTNYSGTSGVNTGGAAARVLSDLLDPQYAAINTDPTAASLDEMKPSCKSIAGKFIYFYTGDTDSVRNYNDVDCSTPFKRILREKWSKPEETGEIYRMHYTLPTSKYNLERLFSAYRPGVEHDAGAVDGVQTNAIRSSSRTKMVRNYYSTKFIPLKSISSLGSASYGPGTMIIYSEGAPNSIPNEANRSNFKNPLDDSQLSIDINTANH